MDIETTIINPQIATIPTTDIETTIVNPETTENSKEQISVKNEKVIILGYSRPTFNKNLNISYFKIYFANFRGQVLHKD